LVFHRCWRERQRQRPDGEEENTILMPDQKTQTRRPEDRLSGQEHEVTSFLILCSHTLNQTTGVKAMPQMLTMTKYNTRLLP
jgi:hypothetical protein